MKQIRVPFLPPITMRVLATVVVLVVGLYTNSLHKNLASGFAAAFSLIALSVWFGNYLSQSRKE